jgi:hypothetical protein
MEELMAKRIRPVIALAALALMIVSCEPSIPQGANRALEAYIPGHMNWYPEGAQGSGLKVVSSEKANSPQHHATLGDSDEILCVGVEIPIENEIRVTARFLLGRYGNLWEVVDVEGDEKEFLRVGCKGW